MGQKHRPTATDSAEHMDSANQGQTLHGDKSAEVNGHSKEYKKMEKQSKRKLAELALDEPGAQSAAAEQERKAAKKARKAEKARLAAESDEKDTEARKAAKAAKKVGKAEKASRNGAADHQPALDEVTMLSNDSFKDAGYTESSELAALPEEKIQSFLSENFIKIEDPTKQTLRPILSFQQLPLRHERLRQAFTAFKSPTAIQAAAWPFLLRGSDVVGVAETGSGKTMAFGVPCVEHVASIMATKKGSKGAKAVIVAPTRELAMQSFEQLSILAKEAHCRAVCIYGGMPKDEQRAGLARAQIIVATPGRLNDFIQEGAADLSDVGFVVLDEADRMLDKGFEDEVRRILSACRSKGRQTAMFTATWPPSVRELAATFMKSPVMIFIGDNPTGDLRANLRITQQVEVLDPRGKESRLMQLLKQYQTGKNKNDRILVFCLYKKEATRIEGYIRSKGLKVAGIHGDLSQVQRTASLDAFREGKVPLLVATDVAARGLDIPAVKVVINLTFPLTVEDYVHRIGRTGRAGKEGLAITLFTENDKAQSGSLINVLRAAKQPVPEALLKFGTTVKKKTHDAYGAFYREPVENVKATKITFD